MDNSYLFVSGFEERIRIGMRLELENKMQFVCYFQLLRDIDNCQLVDYIIRNLKSCYDFWDQDYILCYFYGWI